MIAIFITEGVNNALKINKHVSLMPIVQCCISDVAYKLQLFYPHAFLSCKFFVGEKSVASEVFVYS